MAPDVDLVILGGGCAGLSLAWRLAELGKSCPKVVVVEKRISYTNDRTWCFWDDHDARLDGLITRQWRSLKISALEKTVHFDCGTAAYQMLAASNFYDRALQVIGTCPAITLQLGQAVAVDPSPGPTGWTVLTDQGTVTSRWVVDTRPQALEAVGGATLWQSFYGHEIHCDVDIFTPELADLMNFTEQVKDQISFTYVLPITKRHALIEATVFSAIPIGQAELADQLDASIKLHTAGSDFSVLRSESGILPMGLIGKPQSSGPGHVRVGITAGGARPSSGFAFQRIQKWAMLCCAAVVSGHSPTGHQTDQPLIHMMDKLFLHVLREQPQAAPALFLSLFEHANSASVIRFLSGNSSFWDCVQIMKALPAKHFLQQLWLGFPGPRSVVTKRTGQ